jgi:hypothetical protein
MTPADARRRELLTALVRDLRQRGEHAEATRVRTILRRVIGKGARATGRPSAQLGLFA